MKLKALLLGSAAAMIAVSGARAADAVIAEPEPVEYVKVCDMYGAGYFYIPGSETCLRFSGEVRSTYSFNTVDVAGVRSETAGWTYRARLNVQSAAESDLGTVSTYIRLQGAGGGGADAAVGIDRALLAIGGLRIGYSDQYWSTNHGYGTPGPIQDSPSGFDQALFIDYTFAADGFAGTVGVQDEVGGHAGASSPDIYGGINYGASFGTFAGTVAYDSFNETGAGRVSLSLTVIEGLEIKGLYASTFEQGVANRFLDTGTWEYGIGANYQATDAINVYAAYSDAGGVNAEAFVIGGRYRFSGIALQAEVAFEEGDDQDYRVRVSRSF